MGEMRASAQHRLCTTARRYSELVGHPELAHLRDSPLWNAPAHAEDTTCVQLILMSAYQFSLLTFGRFPHSLVLFGKLTVQPCLTVQFTDEPHLSYRSESLVALVTQDHVF